MDFWGFLRRLGGALPNTPLKAEQLTASEWRVATAPSDTTGLAVGEAASRDVMAHILWERADDPSGKCYGRGAYCDHPERAHDLEFLGQLLCRINALWTRNEPQTGAEAAILERVQAPCVVGRRVPLS